MRIRKDLPAYWLVLLLLSVILNSGCRQEIETPLVVDFEYLVADSNYNAPVRIGFENKTSGALFYKWTFSKGDLEESNSRNPGYIVFKEPGSITVKLEAWNDFKRSEKTIQIILDTVPVADFVAIPRINNFTPVDWDFNFSGKGATKFKWFFQNGSQVNSSERNPRLISYSIPGTYLVKLEITNDRGRTDTISKYIAVKPALSASFEILPSFDDDDFEAPFTAILDNHTENATIHQWQATGGIINYPTDSVPTVVFNNPGIYSISYTASNQKQTQVVTKTITVKPNTRLRTFQNVSLGINTAHKTIGSFFSTYLRKVIQKDSVNTINGPFIDICFFGLSSSFSFNKFLSPTVVQNWTFQTIPGAKSTTIINKLEACNCGTDVSALQFDNISDGSFFDNLAVTETVTGVSEFDSNSVPRIVMFKNASGKKGAIKIKQFVDRGDESYIICDIKIQKD